MLLHLLQSGVILPKHLLTHVLGQHLGLDRWRRTLVPWARNGAALRREHSERIIVDLALRLGVGTGAGARAAVGSDLGDGVMVRVRVVIGLDKLWINPTHPDITRETVVAREVLGVVALALDAFTNIIRVAAHGTIALVGDGESIRLFFGLYRVR